MGERLGGESLPLRHVEPTGAHRFQHLAVIVGIDDHCDVGVVLG